MTNKSKPVVQYATASFIRVGERADVVPVDHPDTFNVTNGEWASTSKVLSYDANTGEFETLNTRYVPDITQAAAQ